jgi:aerobic C4-dicarboxylate transport protein
MPTALQNALHSSTFSTGDPAVFKTAKRSLARLLLVHAGYWFAAQDALNRCVGERSMTTITTAATPARKPLYTSLFVQVLAALVLGIALGMTVPDFAVGLKIFSDAFLKLISMIVAPIVFCVVVHGIAGAGDLKKVGRVGVKALVYFEVMTTVALVVGLLLAYLFGPGHGMNIDPSTLDAKALNTYADNAHRLQGGGIGSFLLNIIPTTSFDALARNDVLQVLFFAIIFGVSLALVGGERASASVRSSKRYRPFCSGRWG